MQYSTYSHRNALIILENDPEYRETWAEIKHVIESLSDERIIECYNAHFSDKNKSLSTTINKLLKDDLVSFGWNAESDIFKDTRYNHSSDTWRLDFAKDTISVEVAFNHGSAIAWNLLKPVLASELNHVEKAIQTKMGIIICATNALKKAGNFDSAVGSYEKFLLHLPPMMNQLNVPLLIIGLEPPSSFKLVEKKVNGRKLGHIHLI